MDVAWSGYGGAVLAQERRRRLIEEVTRTGRVVTSEFAARHGVSEVTVRSDLERLRAEGRIARTHGGAVAADIGGPVEEFDTRMNMNRAAKQRIAASAAQFVGNDQTVMLDGGTTVHHLARCFVDLTGLTVYTPAVAAAQHLMYTTGIDVRLMGGRMMPDWLQTVGTSRELGVKGVLADTLFLGIQGIDDDLDLVGHDHELVATKRRMIRRARRTVLLIDGSKWSTPGRVKLSALSRVDVIVTDVPPPAHVVDRLHGSVEWVVADDQ